MRFQIIPISGSLIATDQESSVTLEIHYLKKWMKHESSVTSLTWKRHWKNNRCPMGQLGFTSCRTIPLRQIGPVSPWVGCSSKGWLDSFALCVASGTATLPTETWTGRVNLRLSLYRRKLFAVRFWALRLARSRMRWLAIIWNNQRLMKRFEINYRIEKIRISIMER